MIYKTLHRKLKITQEEPRRTILKTGAITFHLFFLAIALSALLRFTASDYPLISSNLLVVKITIGFDTSSHRNLHRHHPEYINSSKTVRSNKTLLPTILTSRTVTKMSLIQINHQEDVISLDSPYLYSYYWCEVVDRIVDIGGIVHYQCIIGGLRGRHRTVVGFTRDIF